ncbi:tyrosine-type recombinase/integrase [Sporosarcina sp. P26b]|uniref:tyrosine-type recombinase/integrase n=1 Tax=Sporosarcina sp. P26b TaxID=2048253 RepID=UPI0013041407|nr:tyrosine-type recombinase/integrase [Sporosarcina sp. P26b]
MMLLNSLDKLEQNLVQEGKSEATIDSYLKSCKRFANWIQKINNGPVFIEQVKEADIQKYLHELATEANYKPASINVALNGLRNLFQYGMRSGLIENNPTQYIKSIKNNQKRRDYLTAEEIEELLAALDHKLDNLVVRTLAYTGLRISECLALTPEDIDFKAERIHVRNGKGSKPRTVPLAKNLKPHLLKYKNGSRKFVKDSEFFFATTKTGAISAVYINRLLKETVEKLKWTKHVTCHVLRHSFASELVKNDTALPTVAALLGHADFRTVTSVYVHIADEVLQSAVDSLDL